MKASAILVEEARCASQQAWFSGSAHVLDSDQDIDYNIRDGKPRPVRGESLVPDGAVVDSRNGAPGTRRAGTLSLLCSVAANSPLAGTPACVRFWLVIPVCVRQHPGSGANHGQNVGPTLTDPKPITGSVSKNRASTGKQGPYIKPT